MAHVLFLFNTNTPFIFLFGPLIFMYGRSLSGRPLPVAHRIIHFLPFIFYLAYSCYFFLQAPAFKLKIIAELLQIDLVIPDFERIFPVDPLNIQGWVVVEILSLHLISYGIATLLNVRGAIHNRLPKTSIHWIRFMNFMLILAGSVLFLAEGGVINGRVFFESPLPPSSSDLFGSLCMYALTFYLLSRPEVLKSAFKKYKKSSLSKSYMRDKLPAIQQTLEQDKLFLQTDFSLDLLAQRTRLSKHHISQIINTELDCSFFDLTNRYRIEEAKRVLQTTKDVKMEQLAYQLGYKSKSSFFNAFKKATSLTPSRYLAGLE